MDKVSVVRVDLYGVFPHEFYDGNRPKIQVVDTITKIFEDSDLANRYATLLFNSKDKLLKAGYFKAPHVGDELYGVEVSVEIIDIELNPKSAIRELEYSIEKIKEVDK